MEIGEAITCFQILRFRPSRRFSESGNVSRTTLCCMDSEEMTPTDKVQR